MPQSVPSHHRSPCHSSALPHLHSLPSCPVDPPFHLCTLCPLLNIFYDYYLRAPVYTVHTVPFGTVP
ncbi:unnamed protein product [Chondrus crispus]|uniref:Uncharacterized protein n=1 Tax=Chondrus crispus TaxID=2769 RepID=R7QJL6_CHOCR|nr:unnamed protein product [Chondrus crispus]CDF37933.1 unnamed protein product [Chondrus crispus]|eukprot:XP_005717804.1 unnamed protein product [Chondrus crispus]